MLPFVELLLVGVVLVSGVNAVLTSRVLRRRAARDEEGAVAWREFERAWRRDRDAMSLSLRSLEVRMGRAVDKLEISLIQAAERELQQPHFGVPFQPRVAPLADFIDQRPPLADSGVASGGEPARPFASWGDVKRAGEERRAKESQA